VPGFDARAVASSGVGSSLDRSPGSLAVKSSGLTLIPMVSRRSVARRRPGCGLALQPWGVVFVTAGVVQGVAQARDHLRVCRFGLTGGFRATNSRARMSVEGRVRPIAIAARVSAPPGGRPRHLECR
jgi:hypothetical protein